jgi:putative SOS response-associated peptidase YedK
MCGRFALASPPKTLAEHFKLSGEVIFHESWNIAPSTKICSITANEHGTRSLRMQRWGLVPGWAKDASIGNKLSNARGETVAEKPSFRSAFKARRCIIPASGFFEWRTEAKVKQPFYMSFKSGDPMAFAGIWETWGDIETCCIITTSPNSLMEPIHDRMPVILDAENWAQWLSPTERDVEKLLPLIRPHDAQSMQAWAVSREVNKVGARNDDSLITPLTQTLF